MPTVIPTLSIGPIQQLTSDQDKIAYIIKFALYNPGATSSMFEEELVSFRKLEAKYGEDGARLAQELGQKLSDVIFRYFGNKYGVDVSNYDVDVGKFGIAINVIDNVNQSVLIRTKVDVVDENTLNINYDSSGVQ